MEYVAPFAVWTFVGVTMIVEAAAYCATLLSGPKSSRTFSARLILAKNFRPFTCRPSYVILGLVCSSVDQTEIVKI